MLTLGTMRKFRIRPVWADSLGAKSFCTLVETPDVSILIDPGVAIMHRSFPASRDLKARWRDEGRKAVISAAEKAQVVVITHYHYDHFTDFDERIYRGKLIVAKSPNEYINDSQRRRAIHFYSNLFAMDGVSLEDLLEDPAEKEYPDPLEALPKASSRDYGDYWERKRELLEKGRMWFRNRVIKWNGYRRVPEYRGRSFQLVFAENRQLTFGGTKLRLSGPLFHGIEFSRVGWVVSLVIEYSGLKLLYTSDLNGPIIEDYAEWIIREKPSILLLDGPATYTLGYMLNLINLKRAIENISRIIVEAHPELIVLDHHLPREPRFKERLSDIYSLAAREHVKVLTVAECMGIKPAVLRKMSTDST